MRPECPVRRPGGDQGRDTAIGDGGDAVGALDPRVPSVPGGRHGSMARAHALSVALKRLSRAITPAARRPSSSQTPRQRQVRAPRIPHPRGHLYAGLPDTQQVLGDRTVLRQHEGAQGGGGSIGRQRAEPQGARGAVQAQAVTLGLPQPQGGVGGRPALPAPWSRPQTSLSAAAIRLLEGARSGRPDQTSTLSPRCSSAGAGEIIPNSR